MARRLGDLGEHPWIARLLRRLTPRLQDRRVLLGPGDDAAVVRPGGHPLVLTIDTLVEGVHFRRDWFRPGALGRRATAVNVSDVAAMGAVPRWILVALEAPATLPVSDADALVAGIVAEGAVHGALLVGGNVTAGRRIAVTIALVGEATGRIATRAGARPGDGLWVTGVLGRTGAAVRARRAGRRVPLPALPRRVVAGRLLARVAHAMIDVSDGLVQDTGHLCRASGVAAEIAVARLPVAAACRAMLGSRAGAFAATAGEDYELVIAVPPSRERLLARLAPRLGCRLTRIGRIVRGRPAVRLLDAKGVAIPLGRGGFDHFRRRG